MNENSRISIVLSGAIYKEYDLRYTVSILRTFFCNAEIILSTNDESLLNLYHNENLFDIVIKCPNIGELPSLKFPQNKELQFSNNNINKQLASSFAGINAATNNLVMKLRTDQMLLNGEIVKLWNLIRITNSSNEKNKCQIITSSIFSINPRFSERMPFHIGDMFQFGYKEDLLRYYSAPNYPFEYSIWYENHPHEANSNFNEKAFRSRFAVEQWLALHYIYGNEKSFPIQFHNNFSIEIIEEFESVFPEYFIIAHPDDIGLRASKFESARSYFNTQCYSTYESIELLKKKNPSKIIENPYLPKGINKNYYVFLRFFLELPFLQLIIRNMPKKIKSVLKKLIS